MDIQKLPAWTEPAWHGGGPGRPETGPMQFGEDWPGVFIRGDNALVDANALDEAIKLLPRERWDLRAILQGLSKTLRSCSIGNTGWPPNLEK